jgi:hypothetical protein
MTLRRGVRLHRLFLSTAKQRRRNYPVTPACDTVFVSIEPAFTLGYELRFQNLSIVPLIGLGGSARTYDILDEALGAGTVQIREVSDAGSVPEVSVRNNGQQSVLIVDGEQLVGAKQNRAVNLSVLIPAATAVQLPVTCVESGRWRATSQKFSSSSRVHFASGRAAKNAQVSESLMATGAPNADQGQVWDEIASHSQRLGAHSPTNAMSDVFEAHETSLGAYVDHLEPARSQIGAVFLIDGEPVGMDLFQHTETYAGLAHKLVRGYAFDALARAVGPPESAPRLVVTPDSPATARAREFVSAVFGASRRQFPAIGAGETWRLSAPPVAGGALTLDGELVHLSAFPA